MGNLLKDASILLTPTGYDNGSMNAIKPENGGGDFTFSRNSAATRVNAQGLVENVQIISPELVSNGDFSQIGTEEVLNGNFSQEGSELITNGSFENNINGWLDYLSDSSWDNGTIKTTCTSNSAYIRQNSILTSNKQYKITFKAKASNISQNILIYNGVYVDTGLSFDAIDTYKEFTYYLSNISSSHFIIGQQNLSIGDTINFDNVSVKEVGQNWELDTGWSIGDDKVEADGTSAFLIQSNFQSVASVKSYKIQYEVLSTNGVNIRFGGGSSMFGTPTLDTTTIGVKTIYLQSNGTVRNLQFQNNLGFIGSITNISVKEVGQDWTFGTDVVVGDSVVKMNNSAALQGATQTNVITSGNLCKVSFEVKNYVNGIVNLRHPLNENVSANGVYNFVGNANDTKVFIRGADTTNNFEITNISVKEITDDTDLPRINYSGFSYQDSLGSELVTNGDFATDSDWSKDANWTIANGIAASTGTGRMFQSIPFLETNVGTKVKVSFDITDNSNGGVVVNCYGSISQLFTGVGTHTFTTTTTNSSNLYFNNAGAGANFVGSIDNVSVKEYLGQEVIPDSGCGSWLLEPQSTNLITYSEDFRLNSNYSTNAPSNIFESGYLAPDGSLTATRINGFDGYYVALSSTGTGDSRSMYVKSGNGQTGNVNLLDNNSQAHSLFEVTNEWKRVEVVGNDNWFYIVDGRGASLTLDDVIVWGLQQEDLPYATSYIPTNGATSTRLQDIATNSGNSTLINSTEGVLYAEISALSDDTSTKVISLSDSSSSNKIELFYFNGTTIYINVFSNGVSQGLLGSLENIEDFNKIAFKYKENDFALWVNGTEVATDTSASTPIGLSELAFDNGTGGNKFIGKVKALAVYKEALTDAELQSLTTI